jgi:C_GCAxxG_C_C family probable redox protein
VTLSKPYISAIFRKCVLETGFTSVTEGMKTAPLGCLFYPDTTEFRFVIWSFCRRGNIMDTRKEELMQKAYETGFFFEKKYRGCGQCALAAVFDFTGQTEPLLFQAATGFSGGMALCGDGSCGGYAAGILALGLYRGRRLELISGDKENQYKAYDLAQRLHDRFIESYGSVICSDIHRKIFGKAFCLRTKAVRDEFELAGAHIDKCTTVIGKSVAWVAEILYDEGFIR